MKSLQKEQNSANLLLWIRICWNKRVQSPQSESTPRRLTLIRMLHQILFHHSVASYELRYLVLGGESKEQPVTYSLRVFCLQESDLRLQNRGKLWSLQNYIRKVASRSTCYYSGNKKFCIFKSRLLTCRNYYFLSR